MNVTESPKRGARSPEPLGFASTAAGATMTLELN